MVRGLMGRKSMKFMTKTSTRFQVLLAVSEKLEGFLHVFSREDNQMPTDVSTDVVAGEEHELGVVA